MNLLNYTSVPIRFEMQVTPASLQIAEQQAAQYEMTRTGGTMAMESQMVKVRLDTFERRSSMGLKGMPDFINDAADRGRSAGLRATRDYAEFGNQLINIQKGANIPDALFSQYMQHSQAELVLMPLSPTDISWVPSSLNMDYSPVDLNFNWNMGGTQMQFVPGSISMNITQYPSIQFEYTGGPIYAPPSADPNYQGEA